MVICITMHACTCIHAAVCCCCSISLLNSLGVNCVYYDIYAVVHWQVHSVGWEESCVSVFYCPATWAATCNPGRMLPEFVEGGCCDASLSWLKVFPASLSSTWQHFNGAVVFLLVFLCCETAQTLVFLLVLWHSPSLGVFAGVKCAVTARTVVFLLVLICCDTDSALVFLLVSVCCNAAQVLVFLLVLMCCDTPNWVFRWC